MKKEEWNASNGNNWRNKQRNKGNYEILRRNLRN